MDNENPTKEEIIETPTAEEETKTETTKENTELDPNMNGELFEPITKIFYKNLTKSRETGTIEVEVKGVPELMKYYTADGVAHQFVDAAKIHHALQHKLVAISKLLVTNNAMREAS